MIAPAYEAGAATDGTYTESEFAIGAAQELAQRNASEAHKKLESFILQNLSADQHQKFWDLLATCERNAGREAIEEHKAEAGDGKRARDDLPTNRGRAMDSTPDAIAAMVRRTVKVGPVY